MMNELNSLNKYKLWIIISSIIFLISMLGFMFNSRVRISKVQNDIPDIVINDSIDIDSKDTEPEIITSYDEVILLVSMILFPYVLLKIWRIMNAI